MSASSSAALAAHQAQPRGRELFGLSLTSLGVVYGDIGTSPLYAMRECFHGEHAVAPSPENILGVLSLVFWALLLIISGKYVAYVLRADNHGEGGILALMALAMGGRARNSVVLTILGLLGAALLYGDGMITPAISVLSAVEGLEIAAPGLANYVVPITIVILFGLFWVQRRGTAGLGALFGPITLVWFIAIGVLGAVRIVEMPGILQAISPLYGAEFLWAHGTHGFMVLGAVFLVVTGGEALYADMGHFGKRPIRLTWFAVVQPALMLNYFGQGVLLLQKPEAAENPFYYLVPSWALLPMVVLATAATVIASQALISGAFSITRQASMLGYWPRVTVRHTSARQMGQIYVPLVNWTLLAATVGLVLGFGSSANLAAAYGIAVTGTMFTTTLLAHRVARRVWGWGSVAAGFVTVVWLVPDLSFLGANLVKVSQGGWFPLFIGALVLVLMTTWKRGRSLLAERIREGSVTLEDFHELIRVERPARVPGAAVFMTGNPEGAPPPLIRNFEHNRVVHARNVLLTVVTEETPRVPIEHRLEVARLDDGFVRVTARYGFMEEPDVPALLSQANIADFDPAYATYFFGHETLLADNNVGMSRWRKRLFAVLSLGSQRATAFFHIPPDQVIEIGSRIEL